MSSDSKDAVRASIGVSISGAAERLGSIDSVPVAAAV